MDHHAGCQERINVIIEDFEQKLSALAEEYSDRVIGPFCRKHKLSFSSGNGAFAFFRKTGKNTEEPIMDWELRDPKNYGLRFSQETINEILKIYEVLQTRLDTNQEFGFLCPSQNCS